MAHSPTPAPTCPVCGGRQSEPFLAMPSVPVHVGVLWPTREQARHCPRGEIALVICTSCGLIRNQAFDETLIDYAQKYDNALHGSPSFREFERDLVERLITRHVPAGSRVAEIGSGNGRFLGLLCQAGASGGLGIDPSFDPDYVDPAAREVVQFVKAPLAHQNLGDVGLVACCQTLEHVADPTVFLGDLRSSLVDTDAVLYVDVPNSEIVFQELSSAWVVIYEHPLYFVPGSLRALFGAAGFDVLDLWRSFRGQFLSVEARPAPVEPRWPSGRELEDLLRDVTAFADRFGESTKRWRDQLALYAADGRRVAAWGAGARAVTFFNTLEVDTAIQQVVDVNPRKQGTFLAGTGHLITSPDTLSDDPPDVVIALNPLYVDEIVASLQRAGLHAEVVAA